VSARDISETAGGISAAGERHTFNRRTDSRQRGADIVAAIEKSRKRAVETTSRNQPGPT